MKKLCIKSTIYLFLFLSLPLFAGEYFLMKNGKAASCIVLKSNDPVSRHAAEELSLYLGKIANGKGPLISAKGEKGLYPIILELVKDKAIQKEGYALSISKNGVLVQAEEPVGLIYAAYDILKKYGDIRWLIPGKDGEFFTVKPDIRVQDMAKKVSNPSFPVRRKHFNSARVDKPLFDTWDWMLRNNLRLEGSKNWSSRPDHGIRNFLAKRAPVIQEGWHCFTRLHNGQQTTKNWKKCQEDYRKMFQEHPERFPLIAGKRRFLQGQAYQPCTSNKDNIKIIAKNLVAHIRQSGMDKEGGRYIFVNNDNTSWCECENCKKEADPRETKEGHISTRYWKFTNSVVAEARKEIPDLPLVGYGYQNFQSVPLGVDPAPGLDIMLSFNYICYRHNMDDPACDVNKVYFQYFKDWVKKSKNVTTWEEISQSGRSYHPVEKAYANHLKVYHSLGMKGTTPSMPPIDGVFPERYKDMTHVWRAMWQTMYLAAVLQWDISLDADKVLEDANSRFYGKAWNNGMKEYRELLTKVSTSTPGCFRYNHRISMGRSLAQSGVYQKLKDYLAKAEKAAASDPDKRILQNVLQEKTLFHELWEKEWNHYLKNFRELFAYPRTAPIKIDGNLNEEDWKNADVITAFKVNSYTDAVHQSFVRVVYEPDNLYIAMEMMEPTPEKMRANAENKPIWTGNTAELFINHGDMGGGYIQMIFNHKGELFDAKGAAGVPLDTNFKTEAEYKVKVLKDRWVVEMRIPAHTLALKCFRGHSWLVNFLRYRVVDGAKTESSSIASGAVNELKSFLPVTFAARKKITGGMRTEKESPFWRNSNFSQTYKKKPCNNPKYKLEIKDQTFPRFWHEVRMSGYYEIKQHPEKAGDNFLFVKNACFYQLHKGKDTDFLIFFDAKGKGKLKLIVYRYTRTPKGDSGKFIKLEYPLTVTLTENWTTYKASFRKADAEEVLGIGVDVAGECSLDNFFALPVDKKDIAQKSPSPVPAAPPAAAKPAKKIVPAVKKAPVQKKILHKEDPFWKNGDFSSTYKKKPYNNPKYKQEIKDQIFPRSWHEVRMSGYYEIKQHPGKAGDNFLFVKNACFYQLHKGKQSSFRIAFDARGKGNLKLIVYRYTRTPKGDSGKFIKLEYPLTVTLTENWTAYKASFRKADAEEVLGIGVDVAGEGSLDNFFVTADDAK